jgi:hypothetical protein
MKTKINNEGKNASAKACEKSSNSLRIPHRHPARHSQPLQPASWMTRGTRRGENNHLNPKPKTHHGIAHCDVARFCSTSSLKHT